MQTASPFLTPNKPFGQVTPQFATMFRTPQPTTENVVNTMPFNDCLIHTQVRNHRELVCVKEGCSERFKLACIECIKQHPDAKNHNVVHQMTFQDLIRMQLDLAKQDLDFKLYDQDLEPLNAQGNALTAEIDILITSLQAIKEKIPKQVKTLIGNKSDYLKEQRRQKEQLKELENQIGGLQNPNQIDNYLAQLQRLVRFNERGNDTHLELACTLEETNRSGVQVKCIKSGLESAFASIRTSLDTIGKQVEALEAVDFKQKVDEAPYPIRFSDGQRHPSIELKLNQMFAKKLDTQDYAVALLEAEICEQTRELHWAVKINKKSKWIGIGACLPGLARDNEYVYRPKSDQRGFYLINQHGFTYSHHNSEQHDKQGSFMFTTGDTIYVWYRSDTQSLYFSKNGQQPYTQLSVALNDSNLRPCVLIFEPGDEVQVLLDQPIIQGGNGSN